MASDLVEVATEGDDAGLDRLLALCNRFEGLDLPIFLELAARSARMPTHFVSRERGEPIGFAWLPDDPAPEACLMVHPEHRRRGIGRALLAALQAEARCRGLSEVLLVADEAAASGRAFLAAVGARYLSSEFRMALDPAAIDRSRPRQAVLRLRPAGLDDLAALTRLRVAAFGGQEDEQRHDLTRRLREPNRRHFLATLDGAPIGMICAGVFEGSVDVTSFAVLPEHQGRGYGRQILLEIVDMLIAEGWERIQIEVATDNAGALGLYRSCGFAVQSSYGFYEVDA
jgi:ribosomal protein S18 acetylase RimI-like enzyme